MEQIKRRQTERKKEKEESLSEMKERKCEKERKGAGGIERVRERYDFEKLKLLTRKLEA